MVYTFRFFNFRPVRVVANSLDDALAALTIEQRKDVRSSSVRKAIIYLH